MAEQPAGGGKPISGLAQQNKFITGHNADGKAVLHSQAAFDWKSYDSEQLGMSVVYTTSSFPPDLNGDKDIAAHDRLMAAGDMGLVNPGGTVIRCVDFAPAYKCLFHRTQSLDYGIVLEGSIRMLLDDGQSRLLNRGDVAVQRATIHQWLNPSRTEWARMMFVLQDCEPVTVAGKELGEDLGDDTEIPRSRK